MDDGVTKDDQEQQPHVAEEAPEVDVPVQEVGPEPEPEPDAEPAPDVEPAPEPEPEPEPAAAAAPEPEPEPEPAAAAAPEPAPGEASEAQVVLAETPKPLRIPWWPFLTYLALWCATTAAGGWILIREGQGTVIDDPAYAYTVVGGVVLTMAGPLLVIAVWLTVWLKAGSALKEGLLTSALVKGAIVTLVGVVLWWGMLIAVDAMRLGRVW